jgi:hypothetical protein
MAYMFLRRSFNIGENSYSGRYFCCYNMALRMIFACSKSPLLYTKSRPIKMKYQNPVFDFRLQFVISHR